MTTQIDANNVQSSTLQLITRPRITNIQVTNSSYVPTGATTVSTSGGYILITGSNFYTGVQVVIGSALATSVSISTPSILQVQVPAQAAGSYIVYITNTNGQCGLRPQGVTYA